MNSPIIVWFRSDLRLFDHAALYAAYESTRPLIPVFILEEDENDWKMGEAAQSWLFHSLKSLKIDLQKSGSDLILQKGNALNCLKKIIQESSAASVYWGRRYEPYLIQKDKLIKTELQGLGIEVKSFNTSLLLEPWEIQNSSAKPFQVYTPYSKACFSKIEIQNLYAKPSVFIKPAHFPQSLSLDDLNLKPKLNWDEGFYVSQFPGEALAQTKLNLFLERVSQYKDKRDFPKVEACSNLSPHFRFGEISIRQVWKAVSELEKSEGSLTFLKELLWREFAYHLLYHFPHTPLSPLKTVFEKFAWHKNDSHLEAWKKGQTGYPIVDAGMRQLWKTGLMHNRVRMIVASFLVKDLLLPWQEGAKWFWNTLLDADLASNTLGWQWVSGCGADAAPYFRIFNPSLQAEKFDPEGKYVKRWVPELSSLPQKYIHQPWLSPASVLKKASLELGNNYPYPIVDHATARETALQIYKNLKR